MTAAAQEESPLDKQHLGEPTAQDDAAESSAGVNGEAVAIDSTAAAADDEELHASSEQSPVVCRDGQRGLSDSEAVAEVAGGGEKSLAAPTTSSMTPTTTASSPQTDRTSSGAAAAGLAAALPREDASCCSSSTATGSRAGGGEGLRGETVYVRDLHPSTTSEDLENFFSAFGTVVSARVVVNPVTREGRGFGFVSFSEAFSVEETLAQASTCGRLLHGRTVVCERARRNRPHDPTPGEYRGPTSASVKYDAAGHLRPGFLPYWDLYRGGRGAHHNSGGYDYKGFPGPGGPSHLGGGGFFHHHHHSPPYRGAPYPPHEQTLYSSSAPPPPPQHVYYGRYAQHDFSRQTAPPHAAFSRQQQHYWDHRWRSRSPHKRM